MTMREAAPCSDSWGITDWLRHEAISKSASALTRPRRDRKELLHLVVTMFSGITLCRLKNARINMQFLLFYTLPKVFFRIIVLKKIKGILFGKGPRKIKTLDFIHP